MINLQQTERRVQLDSPPAALKPDRVEYRGRRMTRTHHNRVFFVGWSQAVGMLEDFVGLPSCFAEEDEKSMDNHRQD